MYQVYTCLARQHDPRLVLVAVLVCLLASWTALSLVRRGMDGRHQARLAWLAAAAIVTGCGIWATHFIAMLAFATGLPVGYEPELTTLSVLVAILVTGGGFAIAAQGGTGRLWLAGAVVGAGIGAMHYIGMAAVRVPALMSWDHELIAASLLFGIGLGSAAARTALGCDGPARMITGALLLTSGICAMHFTGMGALRLEPTPLLPIPDQQLSAWWLAVGVAGAAAVIFAFAAVGMVVDQHLACRTAREAARLRTLVDATFEGIMIHAEGVILDLNESLAGLLGRAREGLLGCPVLDLLAPECVEPAWAQLASNGTVAYEAELAHADGGRVPVELLGRPIEYHGRQAGVVAVRDVRERRRAEDRIRHLAHHDLLTSLPNRALFRDRLEQALARAKRSGEQVAVLCLDLDRFKEVNDLHGHATGDELLRRVAARLQQGVRESDTVARLGGDEFAIVQAGLVHSRGAATLAERLIAGVTDSCGLVDAGAEVGISAGIAIFPGDGDIAEVLLKKADMALYRAKADGRGTYRTFEPEMDTRLRERRALERDLRAAIRAAALTIHYQPQAAAGTGEIVGFEALVRWPHPERGLVPPSEFIPLAEEAGVIRPLGEWVLRTACAEAAGWPSHLRLGVNLSPAQFRPDLPRLVADVLRQTRLAPERLELEITESVLIKDAETALAILRAVKSLGVQVAMDDFGTGYSSLSYLQRFPFNRIKIDRSFVADLLTRTEAASIVRAIVALSASLRMSVIAEGVESEGQLTVLRQEGCGEVQGYLVGRPMPACEVLALVGREVRSLAARSAGSAAPPLLELA